MKLLFIASALVAIFWVFTIGMLQPGVAAFLVSQGVSSPLANVPLSIVLAVVATLPGFIMASYFLVGTRIDKLVKSTSQALEVE